MNRHLPILDWLPKYQRKYLSTDILAGITVGVMVIPQGMAYGMLAGLPPIYGLYATLVPMIVYVLFGTSRQLMVGPTAMVCILMASGVGPLAEAGSMEYISLVLLLSFLVGCLQFAFGLFRLGFFINFLSHPVLNGFISAAAIIIVISQINNLIGVTTAQDGLTYIEKIKTFFNNFTRVDFPTLSIGLLGLGTILSVKKWNKRIPAPLLVVLISIGFLYKYHLTLPTISIIGDIPKGLPSIYLPAFNLENINALIPTIFTITLVGILESVAIAKVMQAKNKDYEIIPNQELKALGIANIIGSFFQAFPTAGSFSRTAVNDELGAKSGIAALVAALVVLLTLLFLTPLFYYLPKAILAAIIIAAVVRLIDYKEAMFLWKSDRTDFYMLLITFLATLLIGIEQGILIGVFLTILMLLYKSTKPPITIFGRIPETSHYKNIESSEELIIRKDILIIRPDTSLFFANITAFKERLLQAKKEKGAALKLILFKADAISDLDSSATHVLRDLLKECKQEGIHFYFVGLSKNLYTTLKNSNTLILLGGNFLFEGEQEAIDYFDLQMAKESWRKKRELMEKKQNFK